jgi:hypothetical protein
LLGNVEKKRLSLGNDDTLRDWQLKENVIAFGMSNTGKRTHEIAQETHRSRPCLSKPSIRPPGESHPAPVSPDAASVGGAAAVGSGSRDHLGADGGRSS